MAAKPATVIAIYPGSFDPITSGHLDVIERGSRLFDRLIVAILLNDEKDPLFSVEERMEMLREVLSAFPNVEVDHFEGLLVDYASARGATVLLRGIRAISDYEKELQMALMNRRLRPEIETLFLMAGEAHSFISSRLVKEVIGLGGNIKGLVPPSVEARLLKRFSAAGGGILKREIMALELKTEIAERISLISVSSTMKVAADAEKLRAQGVDVVDFGAGEPDFPTPDNVKQAAVRAIEQNFTKYTGAGGTAELKQAVCERHAKDFGTAYQPAECIISVGGKHVIFNLTQALVNPGDEVIIPVPYWVTYKDVVNYAGGKCVFVETDEQKGFTLTAAMIEPHLSPRTKMILINSPSNPSGAVLDREEFEKIYHLTSRRGIYLLTDECYCHFLYEGKPFSIASMPGAKETVLVAGTLSKTYAMTGWRVGFGLVPQPVAGAMLKLQSHSTSNPTSISQKAAVEALRGPQESVQIMLAEYRKRRDFVVRRLREIPGVKCAEPKGAFYAYPDIGVAIGKKGIQNTLLFSEKLLAEAHVAVVPGEAFGTNRHVRISYATSMHELERGLERIHRFIAELA